MTYNYYKAINPLLNALGWKGDKRAIFEALPHLTPVVDLDSLREIFVNLGYQSRITTISFKKLPDHPGIFITKNSLLIIKKVEGNTVHVHDLAAEKDYDLPKNSSLRGRFCYFYSEDKEVKVQKSWLKEVGERFRPQIYQLLGIGLLNAIFALTVPIFIRSVFDWAIPSRSTDTLIYLVYGLCIALLCHHVIHVMQNKSLAYVGARLNMIVGTTVIHKILKLPYHLIEGAPVPDQVARIKQFDGIREFFTSPLAQLVLEGPFFLFFLIVLAIISGPLVIVPIILMLCFAILGFIIFPMVRGGTKVTGIAHNEKISFLIEIFSKINTLKYLGGESVFSKRFEEKAFHHAKASEYNEIVTSYATNLAQILIKAAGVITVIWGAVKVMNGEITVGTLVAIVLLIWRALSPIQSAFMFLSQFDQTASTFQQINQLMSLPSEHYAPTYVPRRGFEGHVIFDNVAFRYPTSPNLALQGVTMEAKKGEIVAIMGENGSGKSTLLKLLLGFYQPLGGNIYVDNVDIKQIPVNHLRKSISFVPQGIQFFHGTIEQNLLLSAPEATPQDVMNACKAAMVWEDIQRMPEGLHTRLTDRSISALNSGFQQKLSLARAYLRKSSIILFDEPGSNLDMQGDDWFKKTIDSWRGDKTMIMVTHRPSVVKIADRLLVMTSGKMKYFGPTHKVLELLEAEKQGAA